MQDTIAKEISPKVSVIIPVYNMGKYVRECLDSVLTQTLQNIEILCVNDGSTDDSLSILLEYAGRDARVKVISKENQGVSVARNHAIQMASGEYIAFMDPDDWYPSADVLESLFNAASMHRVEIAGGSWSSYKNGIATQVYDAGYIFKSEGMINYRDYQFEYGYHRFLYRRLFLIENNIYFPLYKRYQDPPFFVKAMLAAKQFYAIPKIVYAYRKGHKNIDWTQGKILDMISGLRDIFVLSRKENLAALHCCNYRRLTWIAPIIRNLEDISLEFIAKLFELEQSLYIPFLKQGISDFEQKAVVPKLIAECLYKWLDTLPAEDKAAGFDEMRVREYMKENDRATKVENALKKQLQQEKTKSQKLEKNLRDIRQGYSFRIGRIVTWVPRKIRGSIRCFRQHGAIYTAKRTLEHLGIDMGTKDFSRRK